MNWTRRKFVKAGLGALVTFSFIDSFWIEKFFLEKNEFFLGSAHKTKLDIKVVQLSDLHIQSVTYSLRKLAKQLNYIQPELILITGDAVDKGSSVYILNEFLSLINFDIKKVAILGNWEYWGHVDLKELKEVYLANNCDLLINETRRYAFRDKLLSITGVDDYVGGSPDIVAALGRYQQSDYHIVLNHCPQYSEVIFASTAGIPIDFILAGHTHGGQVNLFGFVPFKPQGSGKYLKGWYQNGENKMYVSKGIGTSILSMRFMARAEVAIFYLG